MSIKFTSEKELENAIFNSAEFLSHELGISENAQFFRQFSLPGYGVIDIIAITVGPGVTLIDIIELKNEPLKLHDAAQLSRYLNYFEEFSDTSIFQICGHLIGPKTYPTANDDVFLMQSLTKISVYEFNVSIAEGFILSSIEGWSLDEVENLDHGWLDEYVMSEVITNAEG